MIPFTKHFVVVLYLIMQGKFQSYVKQKHNITKCLKRRKEYFHIPYTKNAKHSKNFDIKNMLTI